MLYRLVSAGSSSFGCYCCVTLACDLGSLPSDVPARGMYNRIGPISSYGFQTNAICYASQCQTFDGCNHAQSLDEDESSRIQKR
ncbi:hypothetical protein LY76DRAFT_426673 [Colletotrichum caudatum]|nr:hypothetical protein LY76DRAFT_426673 [Colletotrichum caudatum]